jgi:3-oxoacyl-[acyl-carrier-protein] synthase II
MASPPRIERRRVVITGLGPVTPIGIGNAAMWEGVCAGKSGAGEITLIDHGDLPIHFACEVKGFYASDWLDADQTRRLDRFTHLAAASATLAVEEAGLARAGIDRSRVGVIFSSGIGGLATYEEQLRRLASDGFQGVEPHLITAMMPNCAAAVIARRFGFTGINYGTFSACASSAHAVCAATRHIQCGDAEAIVVGGSEAAITRGGLAGFAKLKVLSSRNDKPTRASRPFDRDRDGFVMGEGSTALVLESWEHATARSAHIYAEVLGFGMNCDAFHLIEPDREALGITRCLQSTLQDAAISADQVDYINAHGTSTILNDRLETLAIKRVFAGRRDGYMPVSSTKSMTGHLLGAAGATELAICCLAMANNVLPPTINLDHPDAHCDLDYVPHQARPAELKCVLSNSFGFGGHNCTICLGSAS